jgi:hypothetical protein
MTRVNKNQGKGSHDSAQIPHELKNNLLKESKLKINYLLRAAETSETLPMNQYQLPW